MILSRNTALMLSISTLLVSSIGNVFAAGQLCFYCDEKREIKMASEHGDMKFGISQQEFEGKDIIAVVATLAAPSDQQDVLNAFDEAAADGQIHYVAYTLKDEQASETPSYLAEITPVKNIAQQLGFFIKVTENKSIEILD